MFDTIGYRIGDLLGWNKISRVGIIDDINKLVETATRERIKKDREAVMKIFDEVFGQDYMTSFRHKVADLPLSEEMFCPLTGTRI